MIEPFIIHEIATPQGGLLGIARLPGRSGNLAGDVAIIAGWAANLVVSMTEGDEMRAKGGGDLPMALAVRNIGWRHFPIRDFGAPDEAEMRWPPLAQELHAMLAQGGRVLVHCAGGCGRSGMVALRLLVEAGLDPTEALGQIRAVRPCAVETFPQQRWGSIAG